MMQGGLDVILVLISTMQQLQFVALAHVPRVPDPASAARQACLALRQRQGLLKSAAARLRSGIEAVRHRIHTSDRFLADLAEIRKESRLDALDCIRGNMCPTPIRVCTPTAISPGNC